MTKLIGSTYAEGIQLKSMPLQGKQIEVSG